MKYLRLLGAAVCTSAALIPFAASSQADAGSCIVAGRLADGGGWAPRFAGVQLLDAAGRAVSSPDRGALAAVRQARISQPALLSRCDGDNALAQADDEPAQAKRPVPAVPAGVVAVESVAFPKLRTGGALVELKLKAPPERVVMVTR
jgi:hypothetical protein